MSREQDRKRAQERSSSARFFFVRFGLLLLFVFLSLACSKHKEPVTSAAEGATDDVVDHVRIYNAPSGTEPQLLSGIATKKSPRFLWFKKVYEPNYLNTTGLKKDIVRIERQLRKRGYYEARVTATRVIRLSDERVHIEFEVDPGKPVRIRKLETVGLARLPFEAAEAATNEMRLRKGHIFDEDEFEQAKQDVANSLANRGYAYAVVKGSARVDLANHSVDVQIVAEPGQAARLGEIMVSGLKKLEEGPVRSTLKLKPGDRYSREQISEARSALFSLGAFSQVEIVPDLSNPESEIVPLAVRLSESTLREVTLSGGVRLDTLRFAVLGKAGWSHRNFLGGLRKFSVSTRPGLNFFPTSFNYLRAPTDVFPENSLTVRLEQPAFIEGRTTGFAEAGYNIYPLLYPLPDEHEPEEERVIGYNEVTTSLGAERGFLGRLLSLELSANWQANFPFLYQRPLSEKEDPALASQSGLIDGLEKVIVAYPELVAAFDFRDDPIAPTKGVRFSTSLQTAVPVLGGLLTDVRIQPELRTYFPLDKQHKLILANRFTVGMTFPQNYGDALSEAGSNIDYTDPDVVRDQHNLLFRAFYSGGPNSNRGYPYQRIGPQGTIGFLVPSGVDCSGPFADKPPACIRSLGGFTLWEASMELRYYAFENWSFVGFVDTSDVSTKRAHFTFYEPHLSVGPGIRYLSPVGPIRVDLGVRVPGLQAFKPNPDEPPDISEVPPKCSNEKLCLPLSLSILIGEAF